MELKCRWTGKPISHPIIKESKTLGLVSYDAADEDIVKEMKIIDKLDTALQTFDRLKIPHTPYGVLLDAPYEDEEEIVIDTDIFKQKLDDTDEPESRFDVL